jgi:uncharacterized repeat protein (TIGR01451 family)/fimbrial isopeptide formation D2 family protein
VRLRKNEVRLGSFLLFAAVGLLISVLALQQPMEVYGSIDPGLNSGNATVDRTSVPGETILTYTTTGNSTFAAPAGVTSVRVLVIAGGGGAGAAECAGGGGAGGYIENASFAVTPGASMTVTVGAGGAGGGTNGSGQNGQNSVFGSITATGGGGGAGGAKGATGLSGGSGGGGSSQGGSASSGGSGTTGQGNNGGGGGTACSGGGGGGAGAVGGSGSGSTAGGGGGGLASDITGTSVTRAGGGAGHGDTSATGGAGGGGNPSQNGQANTGSGGGGWNGTGTAGAGGSGIVIVRFATQEFADPGGVTGAKMWYKADGSGNSNAQWNDETGFGHHLTQGTTANQPALNTNQINFNPAYVFDGSNDKFSMPTHGIGGSEPMSAFFVATTNTGSGGWRYFNEFGDDTPSIGFSNDKPELYVRGTSPISYTYNTGAVGFPHVFSYVSPNANNQSRIVGVDDSEQTQNVTTGTYTTSSGRSGNSFGSTNGSAGTSWSGPIAEAIYFNKVLTPAERLQVSSYLFLKYGITRTQGASGAGYVDSNGTTIWNADSTFKHDIAGIGRDDNSNTTVLNQKQSKSVNDDSLVTIGHGSIAATNQANTNDFSADKTFLIWGNNDGSTTATALVSGTTYERMDRIWKSVAVNSPGSVEIQIPTSEAGDKDILLISTSPTFDDTAQVVQMSVDGANYEATTSALSSGTHYFTFADDVGSDIEFVSKTATDIGGTTITEYTPGQPLQYELTVRNNGPANAGLVTVTDTLPDDVVPTQATGGGWDCNPKPPITGQTITCTRQSLNSGVTAPVIVIEATVASSVTGQKVNTASASVANDPDTSNNTASVTLDAAPKADLSITKAHTGTPIAGGQLTYDFTVTNDGPSDVSSFTVTDNFDPNLTFSSSSPQVSCTGTTNVSCDAVAPLDNGDTRSFSITVDVDQGFPGGSIPNTATVAPPAGTTDPNTNNDTASDDTSVNVSTDLAISKTHTGDFIAGDSNDFTINVTNNGLSDAPTGSISITDTLDEDFSFVSASGGADWACDHSNGTVTCTYNAALTSGSTTPNITLTVLVDPIVKGTGSNTASVSGTTPDPVPGNNTDPDDNINIVAEADLAITKDHVGTAFTPGTNEQYTFSVTNTGPSADTPTYTITDTLPAGLTYVSYSGGADCSMSSGVNVMCTGGALGVGDPADVTTITVAVDPGASGSFNNSATVAPDPSVTDPNPGNNTDPDTVNIEPNADLAITKTAPGSMTAGQNAGYTLTIGNNGPSNVSSYTVTDDLDPNLSFQNSTPSICTVTGTTPQGGEELTCTGSTLNASGQDVITVTVAVDSAATSGSTISNTAAVAVPAGVNDPTPGNNTSAAVDNTVATEADLAITKTHTGNFTVGGSGSFTLQVTNNGPSDADTVTVTDVLPDGLTYASATSSDAVCNNAGQTVTCTIGPDLSNGQSVDITLNVTVDPDVTANSIQNTASVSSTTNDPDTGNNNDPDTVMIDSATADLTATKTAQGSLTAGEPVTYRFEVTNNGGPDKAGVVTIKDTLPSYLSYQSFNSVSGGSWDCNAPSQTVTCTLGVLDVNDTAVVDVTVLVDQDAPDTAVNNASVTFNGTDPSPPNPSDSEPVSHEADLSVTLTHESKTYHSGDTVTFTYTVENHGPSTAKDVVLTDTLPGGLHFENIVASVEPASILAAVSNFLMPTASAAPNTPFNCGNNGSDITCTASSLSVGTYDIQMTAQIADDFTGDLTSMLQISSATPDPNMSNNSSTDTIVDVTEGAGLSATGQNMLWLLAAGGALLAPAAILFVRIRKRRVQAGIPQP